MVRGRFGIVPTEIITFVATMLIRAWMQQKASEQEDRRAERAMEKGVIEIEHKAQSQIRRIVAGAFFNWTFSIVAIFSIVVIVGVPLLAPIFAPAVLVNYLHIQEGGGFFIFSWSDKMRALSVSGISVMPFHTHLVSAIAGAVFGGVTRR